MVIHQRGPNTVTAFTLKEDKKIAAQFGVLGQTTGNAVLSSDTHSRVHQHIKSTSFL